MFDSFVDITKNSFPSVQRYGRIQRDDPATHLLKWSDGHWEGGRENGRSLKADLSGRQPPSHSPISLEEDSPSPSIPCLPSLNWVWPEIEDYPWLLNLRNDTTVEIQFPFIWEILQPFLGNFRFQEDTDFINERPKQETKGVGNHSYWQQGRKGLNDWDRWRKVLIWFHKLPLRQLDYNSSTAVAAIFPKDGNNKFILSSFFWVAVPSFLYPLQNFGISNDHTIIYLTLILLALKSCNN